jgi:hypothetical protein
VYQPCGGCPKLCENVIKPCTRNCKPGCYCIDGLVRDEINKKCVTKENCPIGPCGLTQGLGKCEKNCNQDTQICKIPRDQPEACVCKVGFSRNSNNECVTPDKCEK